LTSLLLSPSTSEPDFCRAQEGEQSDKRSDLTCDLCCDLPTSPFSVFFAPIYWLRLNYDLPASLQHDARERVEDKLTVPFLRHTLFSQALPLLPRWGCTPAN
jgi:hypothetical protein